MNKILDIIIVNWNSGQQLQRCLESIEKFGGKYVSKVIVVDNASADDSLSFTVKRRLPVKIVRNKHNLGFAKACNQGAELGDARYLLFLNPDTELFNDSLKRPLAFMESGGNEKVGICGIQLVGKDGAISRTCARFPTFKRLAAEILGINKLPGFKGSGIHMKDWDHSSTKEVDHVIGAFFLLRRELFLQLNGFDERFFVYLEDIDLSYRANQAGWRTFYLADAAAFHLGGGTSRQIKGRRLYYALRSRILYAYKHFDWWQASALLLLTLLAEPITRTIFCVGSGNPAAVKDTASAYLMLYKALPDILRRSRVG